ncbi:MAG TPA: cell wall hydrolase [Verrucomicrobiae bacterium]|nr:cell wall hydrolase [Verrucomicrobiae bacterium]
MPLQLSSSQAVEFSMLVLVTGREARGDGLDSMRAVAWSIRNRVSRPSWWGRSWIEVITKKWQYSSINGLEADPNLLIYPVPGAAVWNDAISAAEEAYSGEGTDPTGGAVSYYDRSLDDFPPLWAKSGQFAKTVDIGRLHFFRLVLPN